MGIDFINFNTPGAQGLDDLAKTFKIKDAGIEPEGASGSGSFAQTLKDVLGQVSEMDNSADAKIASMNRGENVDPHDVLLAVQEANMALDLLIQVRNRLVDAYQELSRTPL